MPSHVGSAPQGAEWWRDAAILDADTPELSAQGSPSGGQPAGGADAVPEPVDTPAATGGPPSPEQEFYTPQEYRSPHRSKLVFSDVALDLEEAELSDIPAHPDFSVENSWQNPSPDGEMPELPPMRAGAGFVRFDAQDPRLEMDDGEVARSMRSHEKIKNRRATGTARQLGELVAQASQETTDGTHISVSGGAVQFDDNDAGGKTPSEHARSAHSRAKIMQRQLTGLPDLPATNSAERSQASSGDKWIDSATIEGQHGQRDDRSDILESLQGCYDELPSRQSRQLSSGVSSSQSSRPPWQRPGGLGMRRRRASERATMQHSVGTTDVASRSLDVPADQIHRRRATKRERRMEKVRAEMDRDCTFQPAINNAFHSSRGAPPGRETSFVKAMEIDIRKRREMQQQAMLRREECLLEGATFAPATLDYEELERSERPIHERLYEVALETAARREREAYTSPHKLNLDPSSEQMRTAERLYRDAELIKMRRSYHQQQIEIEEERRRDRTKISAGSIRYAQQRLHKNLHASVCAVLVAPAMSGGKVSPDARLTYPQLIRVFKGMGFYSSDAGDKNTSDAEVLSADEVAIHDRLVHYLDHEEAGHVRFEAIATFLDTFVLKFQREGFRQRVLLPLRVEKGPWRPASPTKHTKFDSFPESPAAASIQSPRPSRQPVGVDGPPSAALEKVTADTAQMLDLTEQFRQLIDRQLTCPASYALAPKRPAPERREKLRFLDGKRTTQQQVENAERLLRWQAQAEERRRERQEEQSRREAAECTFRPAITSADKIPKALPRARKVAEERSQRSWQDASEELYHRAEELEARRKERVAAKTEAEEQEFEQRCTFKPERFTSDEKPEGSFPRGFAKAVGRLSALRMERQNRDAEEQRRRDAFDKTLKKKQDQKRKVAQGEPLLVIDVQLGRRGTHKIEVRTGDDLAALARGFCKTHRLKKKIQDILERQLIAQMGELSERTECTDYEATEVSCSRATREMEPIDEVARRKLRRASPGRKLSTRSV